MTLIYGLGAIFALALPAPMVIGKHGNRGKWFALAPAAFFALLLPLLKSTGAGVLVSLPWLPSLDVAFSLYIDGLSLMFAIIISFIGIFILIYASAYFAHHPAAGRFFMIILLFMGAMLGVVLSANLLLMFIFWELTGFTSYLLIGFKHGDDKARWGALQSLLVTGGGGLALLAGILLLHSVTGSFELRDILAQAETVKSHALYRPILLLFALGAFTKSAQVPFHFWLPGAMSAPTPASAYLHSATMVKAGLYLLARMSAVLGGTAEWQMLLQGFGAVTLVFSSLQALGQTDLKKLLAYTTISALGMITLLLGIGSPLALKAATVFLFVHSLYKGSLFMIAGAVDHEAGTRDTRRLSGLIKFMPFTAAAAFLAAMSMMGVPPAIGFIAKELIYEAKLHAAFFPWLLAGVGLFANSVNVAIAVFASIRPFIGRPNTELRLHQSPWLLWPAPMITAAAGLLLGIFPTLLGKLVISPAVSDIAAEEVLVKLKLWHGININLLLGAVTVAGGLVLARGRSLWLQAAERLTPIRAVTPAHFFKSSLYGFLDLSAKITRTLQNGNLGRYLLIIFSVITPALVVQLIAGGGVLISAPLDNLNFFEPILMLLMIAGALTAVFSRSRLTAVAALGFVGYGVALIYLLHGAPDVAITQLVIETLTVVLMVLVLYRLPVFRPFSSKKIRLRDGLLALIVAGVFTSLVLIESAGVTPAPISAFFLENSASHAFGKNVVNVILVDFRGLDTLGEITVLSLAALGVYALLKLKLPSKD